MPLTTHERSRVLSALPIRTLRWSMFISVIALAGCGSADESTLSTTPLGVVDSSWTIETLDGKNVKFGEFQGKVVFVNVWATWCPPCVAEMPSIEALSKSINSSDVAFVIVSDESPAKVGPFVDNKRWQLPFYTSPGPFPDVFQTDGIPATFMVNRKGEVVFRHVGSANWNTKAYRDMLKKVS